MGKYESIEKRRSRRKDRPVRSFRLNRPTQVRNFPISHLAIYIRLILFIDILFCNYPKLAPVVFRKEAGTGKKNNKGTKRQRRMVDGIKPVCASPRSEGTPQNDGQLRRDVNGRRREGVGREIHRRLATAINGKRHQRVRKTGFFLLSLLS